MEIQPLHDSRGHAIAYVYDGSVFLYCNRFVGRLEGDGVWDVNGDYVGEIVGGKRLFYCVAEGRERRPACKAVFAPGMPIRPWGISPYTLPEGYRDVALDEGLRPASNDVAF
jgi:hypothetical protein